MPPNKPQSNYSKKPVKRIRLLKTVPRTSKSLFEEYFYGFLVAICLTVMILGKAGGLSGYDAIIMGLWVGGFTWFAWVFRRYRKEKTSHGRMEKSKQSTQTPRQVMTKPLSANFKPMIGPQWPVKPLGGAARPVQPSARPTQELMKPERTAGPTGKAPEAPSNPNKPAFVYERPTLPNRKPKFPANWEGQQNKKPKK
jgi:hypothetical protein